ncbi:hypothetical protein [Ralstonia soli]|uniref:Uncharacterized protein n=1 Tax=Ralstonia soli TaxID=2953896 RepID=A0ABT1AJ92_9RALS|nr:hypothetical protein [Ralstonia soli]MCO5398480.1 hypothetical protein [Ralstonia soli]
MDVGTVIMSGLRREPVLDAMRAVTENFDPDVRGTLAVPDYENPFVSTQVLRVVLSYIDYINRTVWHKAWRRRRRSDRRAATVSKFPPGEPDQRLANQAWNISTFQRYGLRS